MSDFSHEVYVAWFVRRQCTRQYEKARSLLRGLTEDTWDYLVDVADTVPYADVHKFSKMKPDLYDVLTIVALYAGK